MGVGRRCACGAEIVRAGGYGVCPNCGIVNLSDAERELRQVKQRIVTNAFLLFCLIVAILLTLAILLMPTPAESRRRHVPTPPQRPADIGESVPIDALRREPPLPPIESEPPLHCRIFPILPGCP